MNEEETKSHIARLDEKIDLIKWSMGIFGGLLTILVATFTTVLHLNVSSEKTELINTVNRMEQRINNALGELGRPPELELFTSSNKPLQGEEITVKKWVDKEGTKHFWLPINVRNAGSEWSGPIQGRIYLPAAFKAAIRSDEPEFPSLLFLEEKDINPASIPGNATMPYDFHLYDSSGKAFPDAGKHLLMIRLYYWKGKVVQTHFKMSIEEVGKQEPVVG